MEGIDYDRDLMNPLLSLQKAQVGFYKKPCLKDVNFSLYPGEWVSILGPNGSGKTALLSTLVGALPLISGERHTKMGPIGFVPQKFSVSQDSPLTVEEFLSLNESSTPDPETMAFAEKLHIHEILPRPLRALSRGQLQRALILFSLWKIPEILFLDEYLEGLDPEGHSMIAGFLEMLHEKRKLTVIEVSHDISSVIHVASRVILLKEKIIYDGRPKEHGFDECLHHIYGHHHWIHHD